MGGGGKRHHTKSRRSKKSKSNSIVNLDDDLPLKAPTQVRKDVKDLLLKAIDDAAETLKQLPRVSVSSSSTKSTSSSAKSPTQDSPIVKSPPKLLKSKPTVDDTCPLNPETKKAFSKSYYSRDQYGTRRGHHTVTREYFAADGTPIASPSSKSLANPECLNTIVLQNSGQDATGMILDLKLKMTKPDGTVRDVQLGIEIPFSD